MSKQCDCGCSHIIGFNDNGPCSRGYLRGFNGRCVWCDHTDWCHRRKIQTAESENEEQLIQDPVEPWNDSEEE